MPIIEGKDGTRIVVGGIGDLVIAGGILGNIPDDSQIGFVEIMGNSGSFTPGKVIEGTEQFLDKSIDLMKEQMGYTAGVRLDFRNVESVDQLIDYLQQVKSLMTNKD